MQKSEEVQVTTFSLLSGFAISYGLELVYRVTVITLVSVTSSGFAALLHVTRKGVFAKFGSKVGIDPKISKATLMRVTTDKLKDVMWERDRLRELAEALGASEDDVAAALERPSDEGDDKDSEK